MKAYCEQKQDTEQLQHPREFPSADPLESDPPLSLTSGTHLFLEGHVNGIILYVIYLDWLIHLTQYLCAVPILLYILIDFMTEYYSIVWVKDSLSIKEMKQNYPHIAGPVHCTELSVMYFLK